MDKDFDKWNDIKKEIDNRDSSGIFFKESDIWWTSLGQNVKSESNGKGSDFRRPILILKKLSTDTCIGIPLSTQEKTGTWFYRYNLHGVKYTALLYQTRMIHKNRFQRKLGELDELDFGEIKKRLKLLLNL